MSKLIRKPSWVCSKKEYGNLIQEYWEMIRDLHFGEKGTPYWRRKAEGINVKKNLDTLEDFLTQKISLCDGDELRKRPSVYFVPEKAWEREKEKINPFKSSGTMGDKKPYLWSEDALNYCAEFFNHVLDLYKVEEGLQWFIPGTYNLLPAIMKRVIRKRKGICDFFPVEVQDLKKHLISSEVFDIEETKSNPFLMARFSPLIRYSFSVLDRGIDAFGTILPFMSVFKSHPGFNKVKVILIGMEIQKEKFNECKNEYKDKIIFNTYGNSNSGLFPNVPSKELSYYPPAPLSLIYVVDENDPLKLVKYGERGKLRNLKMDRFFLWNEVQDRDYAERISPTNEFKWDGIKEIKVKWE